MKAVYKYLIARPGLQELQVPASAKVLSVGAQDDVIAMWALVNTDDPPVPRLFNIVGTGWTDVRDTDVFIGTAQMAGMVWHVFQAAPVQEA